MKLKAIITGSSGMVGKGLLLECIEHPDVESVLIVNRHSINFSHPKVKELIIPNFFDLSKAKEQLTGYNTCYFCAGVSSVGLSEVEYTKLTYHMTLNFAETFLAQNPDSKFCYVSGMGTDSSERGKTFWARVKGKTENDLLKMPFKAAYMFRPAFIQPFKGIKSRTRIYNIFYTFFSPLYPLLKHLPKYVTDTVTLGKVMIEFGLNGNEKKVLENININKTGKNL